MRKRYDDAFKQTVVELYQSGQSAEKIAKDYGIDASTVRKWRRVSEGRAPATKSQGATSLTAAEEKVIELQRKLAESEMEVEILKKALRIFSQSDSRSMIS